MIRCVQFRGVVEYTYSSVLFGRNSDTWQNLTELVVVWRYPNLANLGVFLARASVQVERFGKII